MFLPDIVRPECATLVLVWTMILVAVLPATPMLTVTGMQLYERFDSSVFLFLKITSFNFPSLVFGRLGRSDMGYEGSRSSMSSQDSHGLYSSRQGMGYSGGMLSHFSMKKFFY